jgi:H+-transporting ATPase
MEGYDGTRDGSLRTSIAASSIEASKWQDLPHGFKYEEPSPSFRKPELDDNIDALIEELESHNDHIEEEQDAANETSGCSHVPLADLQTNTRTGLTDTEVASRRKKYGLNQMRKEEKQHPVVKFLMFFVGPIQFVMEVSCERCPDEMYVTNRGVTSTLLRFWRLVFKTGSTWVLFADCYF